MPRLVIGALLQDASCPIAFTHETWHNDVHGAQLTRTMHGIGTRDPFHSREGLRGEQGGWSAGAAVMCRSVGRLCVLGCA